ncbi:response regulator [Novosphingobium sediminicola]|uniref:Two-component system response regulator AdeR n=1 Tax=Novosphingobium sediminicola TaxID=563162 RepID=A0A7W6CSU1_9SPHN|nr:response regulator [Novosphingobium sediminicola]MBB3957187.1 two-component system response regulator AdeR [Novosphingobium sediminicola]
MIPPYSMAKEWRGKDIKMAQRILIVEDEREIAELLATYVRSAGFEVDRAVSVAEAIRLHASQRPDMLLLDIGLPGGDGLDVLTTIRKRFETPVIMVTAVHDDVTKLSSLRVGADDYIVKPFNPNEVIERIRAVLRRVEGQASRRSVHVGPLLIDTEARIVTCRGEGGDIRLALTPTEFAILVHLARQPHRAFSRSELLESALPDSDAYDRVVDSHLSKLRQKLVTAGCSEMIEAVRGIGYRLIAQ